MKIFKNVLKILVLFTIGGLLYILIELLWRGHSHWTMFFLGGTCFLLVGYINEYFPWEMALAAQMLISAFIITACEGVAGAIINGVFKLNVWDYSNIPFNLYGQICLPYSILWFFLSAPAIIADDYLRYWLFAEKKPRYKLLIKSFNTLFLL